MELWLIVPFGILAVLLIWLIFETRRQWREATRAKEDDKAMLLMQQQIDSLREQLRGTLDGNTQLINQQLGNIAKQVSDQLKANLDMIQKANLNLGERLDSAGKVVGQVQSRLGQLEEANRRIFDVGKDIASLQEILRAPKLRGSIGELFLGDLLAQILPPRHYTLQHRFKSGEKVDAVIKLGPGLVPVDAKFPLENFKRLIQAATEEERKPARKQFTSDVKKHVDDIAGKYILPDERTFDFALMYIPAENVYYETIIKDESFGEDKSISSYAISKRVIPVSPNSFYAYLQAIILGLRGLKVEESAQDIIRSLVRLEDDFSRFRDDFNKLGTHLTHSKSSYEAADKRLDKFADKLHQVESIEPGPSPKELPEEQRESAHEPE